jgi:uncharacterized protein YuzE
MYITYDEKADAMYIKLKECKIFKTKEIDEDIILDLDEKEKLIGIEILDVSDKISISDIANVNIRMPLRVEAKAL